MTSIKDVLYVLKLILEYYLGSFSNLKKNSQCAFRKFSNCVE